tara:strand:+ start:13721 stop:14146 length:426 start_codon:yes stop_codon:yes gene_type:complete
MFFNKKKEQKPIFESVDIAICTLLIHTAKTDEKYEEQEKELIKKYLLESQKDEKYIKDLVLYCENKEKDSIEILHMTKEIKKLEYNKRLEIVEMMLKIIYSDRQLCNFEDRLIRKVSGLIYIESKDLGEIKIKVKNDIYSK